MIFGLSSVDMNSTTRRQGEQELMIDKKKQWSHMSAGLFVVFSDTTYKSGTVYM
jgi:hypothetical protein